MYKFYIDNSFRVFVDGYVVVKLYVEQYDGSFYQYRILNSSTRGLYYVGDAVSLILSDMVKICTINDVYYWHGLDLYKMYVKPKSNIATRRVMIMSDHIEVDDTIIEYANYDSKQFDKIINVTF